VIKLSPKFEVLAANPLAEATSGSTVNFDGEIFSRTHEQLCCIGTK
jgi:hypothetical protein